MKRRSFIASITTAGLGTILPNNKLIANDSSETPVGFSAATEASYYTEEEEKIPAILQTLENNFVKFDWYEDASSTIFIKQSQAVWRRLPTRKTRRLNRAMYGFVKGALPANNIQVGLGEN